MLNVLCPPASYDICFEPQKTWIEFSDWDTVLRCVRKALDTILPSPPSTKTMAVGSSGSGNSGGGAAVTSPRPLAPIFSRSSQGNAGGSRASSSSGGGGGRRSIISFAATPPTSTQRISLTPFGSSCIASTATTVGSGSSSSRSGGLTASGFSSGSAIAGAGAGAGAAPGAAEDTFPDYSDALDDDRGVASSTIDSDKKEEGDGGASRFPASPMSPTAAQSLPPSPKVQALSRFQYEASQHGEASGTATRTPRPQQPRTRTNYALQSVGAAATFPCSSAATSATAIAAPPGRRAAKVTVATATAAALAAAALSLQQTPRGGGRTAQASSTWPTASVASPATFTASYAASSARKRRRVASGNNIDNGTAAASSGGTFASMCCTPSTDGSSGGACNGSCGYGGGVGSSRGAPFLSPNMRITRTPTYGRSRRSNGVGSSMSSNSGAAGAFDSPTPPTSVTDLEQEEIDDIISTFSIQEKNSTTDGNDDDGITAAAVSAHTATATATATTTTATSISIVTRQTFSNAVAVGFESTDTDAGDTPLNRGTFSPVLPSNDDAAALRHVKWRQPPSERAAADGACDDDIVPTLSGPSTLSTWLANGEHTKTPYGPGIIRPSSILPRRLTKDMLGRLQVINQVDCKFIVCKLGSAIADGLYIVDQHAAHERIRLEDLSQRLCTPAVGEMSGVAGIYGQRILKAATREPPLLLNLGASEVEMLIRFKAQMAQLGIEFRQYGSPAFAAGGRGRPSVGAVHAHMVPAPMLRSTAITVTNFVKVQLGVLNATRGASLAPGVIPPPILDVLNLRACHGAIKFGDPLNRDECARLIAELSQCRIPFQCAHGRPTVVPLTAFTS